MTIIRMTDYTLWTRYDQEQDVWLTECLTCGKDALTESKNDGMLEFNSHLCFVDTKSEEPDDAEEYDGSYWEAEVITLDRECAKR